MAKRKNLKEIAEATGYSISTVSRVLNAKPDVNEQTRERVLTVVGNDTQAARRRRNHATTPLVGFVNRFRSYGISDHYVSQVIAAVNERAFDHAYNLVMIEADSVSKEMRWPGRYDIFDQLAGVVWSMPVFETIHREFLDSRKIPFVVINNKLQDVEAPFVECDNFTAARQAVEYLVGMGHSKIGFIGGEFSIKNMLDRYLGYQQHMNEFGLEVDPGYVINDLGTVDTAGAIEGAHRLIGRKNLPTALICTSQPVMLGVYDVFRRRGIRIPDDVSILSYDDTELMRMLDPPITTFRQPLAQMGEHAVDLLMDQLHHRDRVQSVPHLLEPMTLIVRDSVREVAPGEPPTQPVGQGAG
jgi:LacI family transcriptional regulator